MTKWRDTLAKELNPEIERFKYNSCVVDVIAHHDYDDDDDDDNMEKMIFHSFYFIEKGNNNFCQFEWLIVDELLFYLNTTWMNNI